MNISQRKIVISFSGVSCSGKTTAANMIIERNPGMYLVAFDKQKWLLEGYDRSKDSKLIKDITRGLFEVVCQKSLPIILMTPMRTKEQYEAHKKIADEYGYDFYFVAPTAPIEVLMERFRERIKRAQEKQTKISMTNEGDFLKQIEEGFYMPDDAFAIDTSVYDRETVYSLIIEKIGDK